MSNFTELLPTIAASTGLSAILLAIVNAIFNRRKTSAEATSVITQAAGGLVANLNADNLSLRGENQLLKTQVQELLDKDERRDRREERVRDAMKEHNEYDKKMAEKLREAGIDVPMPPPLEWPVDD